MICTSQARQMDFVASGGKKGQAVCETTGQTVVTVGDCRQAVELCRHCNRDLFSGEYLAQIKETLKVKNRQLQKALKKAAVRSLIAQTS